MYVNKKAVIIQIKNLHLEIVYKHWSTIYFLLIEQTFFHDNKERKSFRTFLVQTANCKASIK